MSLINQVLNQLEQRGAHTAPDQTQIRAVPVVPERDWIKPLMLGAGVVLVAGIAVWGWTHKEVQVEPEAQGDKEASKPVLMVQPIANDQSGLATRLSYELSVLPLPESLREREIQTAPQAPLNRPLVAAIEAEIQPPRDLEVPSSPPVITRRGAPQALKQVSPKQRADADYRKGMQAQQQGRVPEAIAAYESALKANEQHESARLAMAALLQENGQQAAAERLLQSGLLLKPLHLTYAMALARMQFGRDQLDEASNTLQKHLTGADNNADYQAFYAALLQRQKRHKEAVNHFQFALQLVPRNGVWRVGYAISLQALERIEDAKLAYKQALSTRTLSPELTAFVQQKLAGL